MRILLLTLNRIFYISFYFVFKFFFFVPLKDAGGGSVYASGYGYCALDRTSGNSFVLPLASQKLISKVIVKDFMKKGAEEKRVLQDDHNATKRYLSRFVFMHAVSIHSFGCLYLFDILFTNTNNFEPKPLLSNFYCTTFSESKHISARSIASSTWTQFQKFAWLNRISTCGADCIEYVVDIDTIFIFSFIMTSRDVSNFYISVVAR